MIKNFNEVIDFIECAQEGKEGYFWDDCGMGTAGGKCIDINPNANSPFRGEFGDDSVLCYQHFSATDPTEREGLDK